MLHILSIFNWLRKFTVNSNKYEESNTFYLNSKIKAQVHFIERRKRKNAISTQICSIVRNFNTNSPKSYIFKQLRKCMSYFKFCTFAVLFTNKIIKLVVSYDITIFWPIMTSKLTTIFTFTTFLCNWCRNLK